MNSRHYAAWVVMFGFLILGVRAKTLPLSPDAASKANGTFDWERSPEVDTESTIWFQGTRAKFTHDLFNNKHNESHDVKLHDAIVGIISRRWLENISHQDIIDLSKDGNVSQISLRRQLGDFDELNALFKGTKIALPDFYAVAGRVLRSNIDLWATNIICSDIMVDDIVISYNRKSNRRLEFYVDVQGLDIDCNLEWRYRWARIFNGNGSAKIDSDNNNVKTTITFTSVNFNYHPPHMSTVDDCSPSINIKMTVYGGIVARIATLFKSKLQSMVEEEIREVACAELGSLGTTFVSDTLLYLEDMVEKYLGILSPELTDVLHAEKNFQEPEDIDLLDFTSTSDSFGEWFQSGLKSVDSLLGSAITDPSTPMGTGTDLGINKIIRSTILDDEGAYIVPVSNWPDSLANSGVIFEGHDMLTETTMEITQVKMFGLDTFTKFDGLNIEGKYTVTNHLFWEKLAMEIDLTITIKPSSHSDSVIVSASTPKQVEHIKIKTGVDNVDVAIHFFMAINKDILGKMQFASIMSTENIFNCFLDTLHSTEITGLSASVSNIIPPSLEGFISNGIDRIISKSSNAAFEMYEAVLMRAMPNFFEMTVREMLNGLIRKLIDEEHYNACPTYLSPPGENNFIDFRDFFLSPENAIQKGGSGEVPYGDIGFKFMEIMKSQLLTSADNGYPLINKIFIDPATKAQSGIEGILKFNSTIVSVEEQNSSSTFGPAFPSKINLKLFDLTFLNVNKFHSLQKFLETSTIDPQVLKSVGSIGSLMTTYNKIQENDDNSLSMSMLLSLNIQGDRTPLRMANKMILNFKVPNTIFNIDVIAHLMAEKVMTFQLKNFLSMQCWLATIPAPILDANGLVVDESFDPMAALRHFSLAIAALNLDIECVECSSKGLEKLPEILDTVDVHIAKLTGGLVNVTREVMEGEWIQTKIDRWVAEAPMQCPHDLSYNETYVPVKYKEAFPMMSRESVEFAFHVGSMIIQIAAVVVAESHLAMSPETQDPLSGQKYLEVPSDIHLLDLSNFNGTLGGLADSVIDEVRLSLNTLRNDGTFPDGNVKKDIGINILLRSLLLDENRSYTIDFDDLSYSIGGVTVSLLKVDVLGLDTFKSFDFFDVIGSQTVTNKFIVEKLELQITILVDMDDGDLPETMSFTMTLNELNVSLGLLLAIDQDLLGAVQLGSLLHIDQILGCLVSSIYAVEVTELSVSIGDIEKPVIEGFLSDNVMGMISDSMDEVVDNYKGVLLGAAHAFFGLTVKQILNNILSKYISGESNLCATNDSGSIHDFIHFGDLFLPESEASLLGGKGSSPYGSMMRTLGDSFASLLDEPNTIDGTLKLNDLFVSRLTKLQSNVTGSLHFPGYLFKQESNINIGSLKSNFEFSISNIRIMNLDTVGQPFDILVPIEPHVLNNTVSLGVGPRNVQFIVQLLVAFKDDSGVQLNNVVDLSVDLDSTTLILAFLMQVSEALFMQFPLQDITKWNCWLATIPAPPLDSRGVRLVDADPTLALKNAGIFISELRLGIDCLSCSSPGIQDIADNLSSPDAVKDTTKIANQLIDDALNLLGGSYLQVQIDRILNDAPGKCPHNNAFSAQKTAITSYEAFDTLSPAEDYTNFFLAVGIAVLVFLLIVGSVTLSVKCITKKKHEKWIRSLTREETISICQEQQKETEKQKFLNVSSRSMSCSVAIPFYARVSIPFVILGNISLFLSGHLSLGATVNVVAEIAGQSFTIQKFFEFSMAKSTIDMWNAGAKELAILIAIFSGAWPYTKQLITLILWFMPPKYVSVSRRESILLWLDALGKWSMVDIFVLVMSVAGFYISVNSPNNLPFLPENFYSIKLMVVPLWGLYANMIAQLLSQITSHLIIYYHRKIIELALHENNKNAMDPKIASQTSIEIALGEDTTENANRSNALYEHKFDRGGFKKGKILTIRRNINWILFSLGLIIIGLVVGGCTISSFSMEILGLVGIAVEAGQEFEEAVKEHTIFSIVKLLINEASQLKMTSGMIGMGTLSGILVITVFIVPLFQTAILLYRWFIPIQERARVRIFVFLEILQAWQYIEVYILSIMIAAWQMGSISEFMINDYCDSLNGLFISLAYYGIVDEENAQCFRVNARVENGTWMLIAASVILFFLNHFVTTAALHQENDEKAPIVAEVLNENTKEEIDGENNHSMHIKPTNPKFTDYYRWLLLSDVEIERENEPTPCEESPNTKN